MYRLSAEGGFNWGLFRLGICYDEGIGTDFNKAKALDCFERCGLAEAQGKIAWLRENRDFINMVDGEWYDPTNVVLTQKQNACYRRMKQFNETLDQKILKDREHDGLHMDKDSFIAAPFLCDFGENICLGEGSYVNRNCLFLDSAPIYIGRHVTIDQNVQIFTATHPLSYSERNSGKIKAKPVRIGDDVWIGGGAIICPGVSIGEGSTVAPGSVVIHDVPARVHVSGNPAQMI